MRYSGWALLLFGAGALMGLVVVSAGFSRLGWAASTIMAMGIAALPAAVVADWWSHRPWLNRKPAPKRRARSSRRPKSSPSRKRGSRSM
jgi:hypothetical protein